jgi:hypothetical protein
VSLNSFTDDLPHKVTRAGLSALGNAENRAMPRPVDSNVRKEGIKILHFRDPAADNRASTMILARVFMLSLSIVRYS